MRSILFVVLFSICTFVHSAINNDKTDFFVAIKGGISLGSYESGLNWAFLNYIHNNGENNTLASFSGASAGSINSLLSAVEHCQHGNKDIPVNNDFFKTWDVDLSALLKNGEATEALFSRDALGEKVGIIERLLEKPATRHCDVTITMSITRFEPYKIPVNGTGHDITLQRFVVPIKVYAARDGDEITFSNIYKEPKSDNQQFDKVPSVYIHLPEKSNGSISFKRIKELAFASSAFPVAFSPRTIEHCLSTRVNKEFKCVDVEKRVEKNVVFSDGGLFDNSPVGVAVDIKQGNFIFPKNENNLRNIIFYINPDNYRKRPKYVDSNSVNAANDGNEKDSKDSKDNKDNKKNVDDQKTGVVEYVKYFYDSFSNATSFELQKSLSQLENDDSLGVKLITSTRYHHLLADFHAHFGAFYSKDFRMHDYIVGVYDGLSNVATFSCNDRSYTSQCRKDYIEKQIETLFINKPPNGKVHREFITYLFNDEYGNENTDLPDNYLVALNKAFTQTNGTSSKAVKKEVDMPTYLQKLSALINNEKIKKKFNESTLNIVNNYDRWQSDQLEDAFANIVTMQACGEKCKEANESVGQVLALSEPIVDAVLEHMDSHVWPLSIDFTDKFSTTFSLNLGYDIGEPARVYGLKVRLPIPPVFSLTQGQSLDFEANTHGMTNERQSDDYETLSVAYVFHRSGGKSLLLPTIGVGYERSGTGDLYKEEDNSVFITAGVFAELINFKYTHRLDNVYDNQVQPIRSNNRFLISLEVGRIYDIFR